MNSQEQTTTATATTAGFQSILRQQQHQQQANDEQPFSSTFGLPTVSRYVTGPDGNMTITAIMSSQVIDAQGRTLTEPSTTTESTSTRHEFNDDSSSSTMSILRQVAQIFNRDQPSLQRQPPSLGLQSNFTGPNPIRQPLLSALRGNMNFDRLNHMQNQSLNQRNGDENKLGTNSENDYFQPFLQQYILIYLPKRTELSGLLDLQKILKLEPKEFMTIKLTKENLPINSKNSVIFEFFKKWEKQDWLLLIAVLDKQISRHEQIGFKANSKLKKVLKLKHRLLKDCCKDYMYGDAMRLKANLEKDFDVTKHKFIKPINQLKQRIDEIQVVKEKKYVL